MSSVQGDRVGVLVAAFRLGHGASRLGNRERRRPANGLANERGTNGRPDDRRAVRPIGRSCTRDSRRQTLVCAIGSA